MFAPFRRSIALKSSFMRKDNLHIYNATPHAEVISTIILNENFFHFL